CRVTGSVSNCEGAATIRQIARMTTPFDVWTAGNAAGVDCAKTMIVIKRREQKHACCISLTATR
ncbi:MAG TPA: hypothetical protein VF433_05555, partial [Cellvibrio sp.]